MTGTLTAPVQTTRGATMTRLVTIGGLVATVGTAAGAQLAPKQSLAASAPTGCAAFPSVQLPLSTSPLGEDGETRRLIDVGQEAALQGEHAAARDAFTQAASRNPTNALLAYYLGVEHEALGSATDAVREYCRYLALLPTARDADNIQGRIIRLLPQSELARVDEARARFRSGVALLERRQYIAADSMFGAIAQQMPNAPEAWFNRGLARAARGERALATDDFEKYLELSGNPAERTVIRTAMTRFQDRVFGSGQALGSGLAFPGMGQMSTGRPVLGVLVLGAVAGGAVWGMTQEAGFEVRTFRDPFGNTYVDSLPTTTQPNFGLAAAGVGLVWVGAALEAMQYARGTRARAESIIRTGGEEDSGSPGMGVLALLSRGRLGLGLALPLR